MKKEQTLPAETRNKKRYPLLPRPVSIVLKVLAMPMAKVRKTLKCPHIVKEEVKLFYLFAGDMILNVEKSKDRHTHTPL